MQAFQSFLQKNDDSKSIDLNQSTTNLSENEEKVDEAAQTSCCVCGCEAGERRRFWYQIVDVVDGAKI